MTLTDLNLQIECVAIMIGNDIYSLPRPNRHDNVVHWVSDMLGDAWQDPEVQGFLTNKGDFVDRKQAFVIATAAGQLTSPLNRGDELFSEEMW
jgi:hypothetical protein